MDIRKTQQFYHSFEQKMLNIINYHINILNGEFHACQKHQECGHMFGVKPTVCEEIWTIYI